MKTFNYKYLSTTFLAVVLSVPAAATPMSDLLSIQGQLQQKIAQQAITQDSLALATAGETHWNVPAPDFAEISGASRTLLPPTSSVQALSDHCDRQSPDC